jgi:hypothetical protein
MQTCTLSSISPANRSERSLQVRRLHRQKRMERDLGVECSKKSKGRRAKNGDERGFAISSAKKSAIMGYPTSFAWKTITISMIYSMLIGSSVLGELKTSLAADVFPTPPAPENREDVPSPGSDLPLEKRPSIDPGIVITPPGEPHPDSVVDPPVIDPDMSIHPQDAPTTEKPSSQTPLPSEPPEKPRSK